MTNLLELGAASDKDVQAVEEQDRTDRKVLNSKLRPIVDEYKALHHLIYESRMSGQPIHDLVKDKVREIEETFTKARIDPRILRTNTVLDDIWPTDCLTLPVEKRIEIVFSDEVNR